MQRISTILFAVATVGLCGGAGGKTPVARVLEIEGKAAIVDTADIERPAALFGTIYIDEHLLVGKDARLTLAFRSDGHLEQVVKPGNFQVTKTGCQPSEGVERVEMPEQHRATVGKISKGPRGIVQGGVVMLRSPAPPPSDEARPTEKGVALPEKSTPIRPITASTLLTAKPTFSWPALPGAKKYTVALYSNGNRIWSAETNDTRLEYSGEALKDGSMYSWDAVATIDGEPVTAWEGMFHIARKQQREDAAALEKLLAEPKPIYLALAALWYKQNGFVLEAIAANLKLAELNPSPAVYRELAELYYQAAQLEDAADAESKAEQLEGQSQ